MDEFNLNNLYRKFYGGCIGIELDGQVMGVMFSSIPNHSSDSIPLVGLSTVWSKKKDYKDSILSSLAVSSKKVPLREITILPLPQKQVFDSYGRTYVYSRRPERQWTKAIVSKNSRFTDPVKDLISELPSTPKLDGRIPTHVSADIKSLHNLFIPNYAESFKSAIEEIDKFELMSRAISATYFISRSVHNDYPYMLFRFHLPVAFYDDTKDEFTVLCPLFKQEIIDLCFRMRMNSDVKEIKT
jgi:hypothetical protein